MIATGMVYPRSAVVESAFEGFRKSSVDLTPEWYRLGRELRDKVIEVMERWSGKSGFPDLLLGQSFGAGSFGRRTKEQPLDDIDIYLVMNGGGLVMYQENTPAPVQLVGSWTGVLATDTTLLDGPWVSSALVLRRVVGHLGSLGVDSGENAKGKSAYIKLDGINVDICPVLWGRSTIGEVDRYYLPAGRGTYAWKKTNPKLDQALLSSENQKHNEMLLPIIRLMKWWNDNRNEGRLKGIHLEVLITGALRGVTIGGIAPAMHWLLANLPTLLDSPCPDPTGLGERLDANLAPVERAGSKRALAEAKQHADLASVYVLLGDHQAAVEAWRKVFPL